MTADIAGASTYKDSHVNLIPSLPPAGFDKLSIIMRRETEANAPAAAKEKPAISFPI